VTEFAELYERLKRDKAEMLEKIEQLRALDQPSTERSWKNHLRKWSMP